MLNETHRTPLRYKISDFFSSLLGCRYMEGGCGFKVDYREGLQWLTKASDTGDAEANYWIGQAYEQGRGVALDQKEATKWFSKGARMGDPLRRIHSPST